MMTLLLALALQDAPPPAPTAEERSVVEAVNATLVKGSWAFRVVPKADLRDALPQDAAVLAGVPVSGSRAADGTFRASDGRLEMFGRNGVFILNAPDGPLRIEEAATALWREVEIEYGDGRENSRNVTRAKNLMRQYLAIAHFYVYAAAPEHVIARPATDLVKLRRSGAETVDDSKCTVYSGDMKEEAAKAHLGRPFGELMRRGGFSLAGASGKGRVWINAGGLVRRTEFTASGKFVVANDRDSKRNVPVAITVVCDLTRYGEATVEVPSKIERMLKELPPIK